MVFRFTIISDELDDFVRIIEINSDSTFMELHNAILNSVNYQHGEMTSFFICNDDWEKEEEITMIEMETSSEFDNYVMDKTLLEELLEDEKQKLLFTFDMLEDRSFFIELTEIIPKKNLKKALLKHKAGNPPQQNLLSFSTPISDKEQVPTLDDIFNDDELKMENFENIDDIENLI
ncbi:MAG: hypothetical protein CR965_01215 [Paludibacter sp.]|nr:MAG: hypothetical protein CR965_01215 [Paludibacter sp.]